LAFGIWHLAFGIWHLAFGIWHLAFGIWHASYEKAVPRNLNKCETSIHFSFF
jgi:hypothetical protein